jgi:hypothetical protein
MGVVGEWRQIGHAILAVGKVEGEELEVLRKRVYASGRIDRQAADFLVELHKRVPLDVAEHTFGPHNLRPLVPGSLWRYGRVVSPSLLGEEL